MDLASIRVATFNCEWRRPSSQDAGLIRDRVLAIAPNVVCLTEAHVGYFGDLGHSITAEATTLHGPSRRKVLLWSAEPWREVDTFGSKDFPEGRFVSGTTDTPLGPLRVVGVCIPYQMAQVRYGEPKRKPWEQHLRYLSALANILPSEPKRTIVMGDFNQAVPRRSQPIRIAEALRTELLDRLAIGTAGLINPIGRQAIDHICFSPDLVPETPESLSNEREDGRRISDHFGVALRFRDRQFEQGQPLSS